MITETIPPLPASLSNTAAAEAASPAAGAATAQPQPLLTTPLKIYNIPVSKNGILYHAHSENDVNAAVIAAIAAAHAAVSPISEGAADSSNSSTTTSSPAKATTTTATTTSTTTTNGESSPRQRKSSARTVVDGARFVAKRLKRISLIETSSSSSISINNISRDPGGCDIDSGIGGCGVVGNDDSPNVAGLEAGSKLQQRYKSSPSLRHSSSYSPHTPLGSVQSNNSSIRSSVSSSTNSTVGGSGVVTGLEVVGAASGTNNTSNTAKQHDQQTVAVAAISSTSASAAAAAAAATATSSSDKDKEKEKKRKEVSSSRVKKFQRHFSQVSKDEKLINYFSCALVSDILLQGHLYITDQHFAFYSNVFGYVTKVVIPTSSVTKISKEKTAKIIPNAVGVATADERHVFGSFISRESAYRLMCSVCPPLAPAEILPKLTADIEISEEYSIEDDSSCSISGNESPPQLLDAAAIAAGGGVIKLAAVGDGQKLIRRTVINASSKSAGDAEKLLRHSEVAAAGNSNNNNLSLGIANIAIRSSAPPGVHYDDSQSDAVIMTNANGGVLQANGAINAANSNVNANAATTQIGLIIAGSISSTSTSNASGTGSSGPSTSSSPTTIIGGGVGASGVGDATRKSFTQTALSHFKSISRNALRRLQQHSELHVLYVGILLAVVLALFSVFLLYRILDIEAKANQFTTPGEFNWRAGNDEDIFAEALRWQRELQAKSTQEAQTIIIENLEQISKVRRSLETLSMLIYDRTTAYGTNPAHGADSTTEDSVVGGGGGGGGVGGESDGGNVGV